MAFKTMLCITLLQADDSAESIWDKRAVDKCPEGPKWVIWTTDDDHYRLNDCVCPLSRDIVISDTEVTHCHLNTALQQNDILLLSCENYNLDSVRLSLCLCLLCTIFNSLVLLFLYSHVLRIFFQQTSMVDNNRQYANQMETVTAAHCRQNTLEAQFKFRRALNT